MVASITPTRGAQPGTAWTPARRTLHNNGHMSVSYRPWSEGDEVAARGEFGLPDTPQTELDRALLGPDATSPWRRCLVATDDDGAVLGAGAVSEASLHPERLWVYVEVAREHRRQGIGSELIRRLRQTQSPSGVTALRARFTSAAQAAAGFAKYLHMHPIQHSRIVRIPTGSLPEPMLSPAGPTLAEVATGSVELTKILARYYDHVHQSWDPSQMSLGHAQDLLLAPQTGAHGAVVLRDRPKGQGGRILSFAVAYPQAGPEGQASEPESDQDIELLVGHDPQLPLDQARTALRQLLALTAARYPVRVEVDEAAAALTEVLDALLTEDLATEVSSTTLVATA